jgi:NADH-quinone oxidoreductase subunit L
MGLVMTDIKRVVAYSTLNSLGLMFVALGFGEAGVGAAMLYLFAHGFFKALLFLGCGSVIHATEKQEVSELGGLQRKMPITNWTFLIGTLAMAGLVPLSGFFAKDEILVEAKDFSWAALILIFVTLPVTAAYMLRVYLLTFTGEPKDQHAFEHAHESPPIMSWPLVILAVFAAVAGFVVFDDVGEALGLETGFLAFVENAIVEEVHGFEFDWAMAVASSVFVLAGLGAAYSFWTSESSRAWEAGARLPFFHRLFRNKFYIDDFYQWVINNIILGLARVIAFFDRAVVNDTGVNGAGEVTEATGFVLKLPQTGKLPNYALAMILGVAVLAVVAYSVKG